MALPVDVFCRTTAVGGFLAVAIGVVAVGTADCSLGVAGATRAAAGPAGAGPTGNNPGEGLWCSWGYICAGQHVWLDSIWVMFMDVVMCTSVLASPNDLNQV